MPTMSDRRKAGLVDTTLHNDFSLLPQYLEILRSKLRIAVIYGGNKEQDGAVIYRTHNPREWKSYETVAHDIATALRELGFQHVAVLPEDLT